MMCLWGLYPLWKRGIKTILDIQRDDEESEAEDKEPADREAQAYEGVTFYVQEVWIQSERSGRKIVKADLESEEGDCAEVTVFSIAFVGRMTSNEIYNLVEDGLAHYDLEEGEFENLLVMVREALEREGVVFYVE